MKMLVALGVMMLCGTALAASPATISDEEFVQQTKTAVAQAKSQNNEIEFLGWGTATLLDSGRESKIKCGRGNPNPEPGECSDPYPIYPPSKPLADVIVQEQAKKVETKSTKTVWVAWCDINGLSVAFNSPNLGEYELSTVTEVEKNGKWTAIKIYHTSIHFGVKQAYEGPRIHNAGFVWLQIGKSSDANIIERLQDLKDIGVIGDTTVNTQSIAEISAQGRE